jgi:hypothetical protein
LPQDRLLELLQSRARLDPDPVDERAPARLVGLERLGLPTGAIESEHPLTLKSFPQRVLRNEPFHLAYELGMTPECEVGVDPSLEGSEPQLLDPADRRLRERLVDEVSQRSAAPQRQRLTQLSRGHGRLGTVGLLDQPREACQIEFLRADAQEVARRLRLNALCLPTERLPELRDPHLQRSHTRCGRLAGPQVVHQPVA